MRIIVLSMTAIALLTAGAGSSMASTKKWYWTTAQANAIVKARVKIPFCRAYPASNQCSAGKLIPGSPNGPLPLAEVICIGTGSPVGGRYRLFTCRFTALNDLMEGELSVTVIGKIAFRWKLV